jgi:hypothetical protein
VREIGDSAFAHLASLVELSFAEGIHRIGTGAFEWCKGLQIINFPLSLKVIEERAFCGCSKLLHLTFPPGSQLQCIRKFALTFTSLETVLLPATVQEIDPDAFTSHVWRLVQFDGPPPLLMNDGLLCSPDLRILFSNFSEADNIVIPTGVEVIGPDAFSHALVGSVVFPYVPRRSPKTVIVPSSVEVIGDRCFEFCRQMATVKFADCSRLKKIGDGVFAKSGLTSITIPASIEEIEGSAFVDCPLRSIEIAAENRHFRIEGNAVVTSDGTKIVRYFGKELEIIVRKNVEILGKSCFEEWNQLEKVLFENGSKLRTIGRLALCGCTSLRSISIPATVQAIEARAFGNCCELESCLIAENSDLARIEDEAFANCDSLESFYIPKSVEEMGEDSFSDCRSLSRLIFTSTDSLKQFLSDCTLDEALEYMGLVDISTLFQIEINSRGAYCQFEGWSSIDDESSHLILVRDVS